MDQLAYWHTLIFDPGRIPAAIAAILLAVVVGMVTGPLVGNANPFYWLLLDKVFGGFGDRLDRKHRPAGDLMFRGFLFMVFIVLVGLFFAALGDDFASAYPMRGFAEGFVLALCITSGSVWFVLLRLYFALEKKEQVGEGAYFAISRSARTNLSTSDDFTITRVAMNFSALSFDRGLVAPVFWYLVGGLPALFAYAGLAALSWRHGKMGFSKGFGTVPMALEKLLGFIPSLYAAVLLTMATLFTPTAAIHKGIASWLTAKGRSPYEQGGFPLTAMAWALNVSLGGPSQDITGSAIKGAWTGPDGASAKTGHKHLRRAIYINVMAQILLIASLLGAYLWAGDALGGIWRYFGFLAGNT